MGNAARILTTVAALLVGAAAAHAEAPPAGAVPLPVAKTTKVTAEHGPVYYVDGPTVIPKGTEITVQLDVRIVGINDASLDVQGGLKVHGTPDHWVVIENVDFSPTRHTRKGIHLDCVDLVGCRFQHGEGESFEGALTIENTAMQKDCVFDVCLRGGTLKLMTLDTGIPWKIRCASPKRKPKSIMVQVRSSLTREVELEGVCDATFRHCALRGGLCCRGVAVVVVDGCDVTGSLAFHQGPEDRFKKVTLTKCNFFDGCTLVLDREPGEKAKKERVKLDKCYFGPREGGPALVKPDAIRALIEDGEDVPHRRVKVHLAKPADRKHELVNYDQASARTKWVKRTPRVRP